MAKKRERRDATTNPDRKQNRDEHPIQPNRTGPSPKSFTSQRHRFIFFVSFSLFIAIVSFYISPFTKHGDTETTNLSVYERGLVKPNVHYQEILAENSRVAENVSRRHYTNQILAYVTPWNFKGYDLAKKFNSKLTHISPVWYDLKSEGTKLVLEGRHNADLGWIVELRKSGDALVLPRFVIEALPQEYLKKKKQRAKAINLIVKECEEMGYDGIVLESWSRWAAYGALQNPDLRNLGLQFIKQLGETLHSVRSERNPEHHLELIYVIGPPRSEKLLAHDFGPEDLKSLSDVVDGFSLMTYDFSGPQNPGPNAPLKWIQITLRLILGATGSSAKNLARKIFVGVNFYGKDFMLSEGSGGGSIVGREYLALLEKYRPVMQWEDKSEEHLFFYSDSNRVNHAVFYPSLMSISVRLEEARAWGVSISIWEIGQGLDYFFDLF